MRKTKYIGVYERDSEERAFKGKADICFYVTFKQEGKKVWEKAGWLSEGYSAKLAADIRSERLRSIRHGQVLPKKKQKAPLLREAWEKYLAWAETNKTRGGRDDRSLYDNHLGDRFGEKRMDEITPFDLERLKVDLSKAGLAQATVKHCLVLLRQIYNKAITWGVYQGMNPIKGVKMPSVQNQKTRFLSFEDAATLLRTLEGMKTLDLHDMALLSLHTGMRAGEIFNLKGHDLDFDNDLIRISDPKNKSTRYTQMTGAVREMLEKRAPATQDALVFPDRNGKKIVSISQSFRKIVKLLGFNNGVTDSRQMITFHSLRHSFASWLAMQGESLITIKEMLGHKSTVMTERYSHLIADHKKRAAIALENGFEKAKNNAQQKIREQIER